MGVGLLSENDGHEAVQRGGGEAGRGAGVGDEGRVLDGMAEEGEGVLGGWGSGGGAGLTAVGKVLQARERVG